MNLIEALKQANGKPVRRRSESPTVRLLPNKWLSEVLSEDSSVNNRAVFCLGHDNLLADDWYVVEPKSKIEEAIERGFSFADTYVNIFQARKVTSRIVNLALDEAANVVGCPSSSGLEGRYYSAITALKVKE